MADEYFVKQDQRQHANPKPRATRVAPIDPAPIENRDPNNLNSHLDFQFYSVFAEPQTSPQSVDCIWEFSEIIYDCCRECTYKIIGLLCGVCLAIYWGIEFVPIIFSHVWCLTPFSQLCKIVLNGCCKPVWYLCTQLCVAPCTQSCAYLFHNFAVGKMTRPPTPSIFPARPKRKPAPKPVEKKDEPKIEKRETVVPVPVVVAAEKGKFEEFDKDQVTKTVRRQMMLFQ